MNSTICLSIVGKAGKLQQIQKLQFSKTQYKGATPSNISLEEHLHMRPWGIHMDYQTHQHMLKISEEFSKQDRCPVILENCRSSKSFLRGFSRMRQSNFSSDYYLFAAVVIK